MLLATFSPYLGIVYGYKLTSFLARVSQQDYIEAARVRDFISIVVSQDPVLSTREALERAVSEERYDVSA